MNRQKELEREILYHDQMYWEENDPQISDPDYDKLCRELREIDPDSQVLAQVHRAVVGKGAIIERDKPMLSLDKAYEVEEVKKWAEGVARGPYELFRIGSKFDGAACEIDGDIMATSGDDGYSGEDISDKLVITDLSRLGGRTQGYGELVVLKSRLPMLRRSNGDLYKNERAAAIGLLNADDTPRGLGRIIQFMPHDETIAEFSMEEFDFVDWDFLIKTIQGANFPADGLVIALVDIEYGESLGATNHHPRHSIALKFKNPSAQTELIDVEWQCGKHKLTPVAILKPVVMSGCTHDRASLHNVSQIAKLGLTLGAKVKIERCGDVIPQVSQLIRSGSNFIDIPDFCPACAASTHIEVNERTGTQNLICSNPHCGGALAKKLLDSLNRLDIENIGPSIVSDLIRHGVTTIPQIFSYQKPDWEQLDGFAKLSAAKMFSQFQRVKLKPVEDYKILAAMNISSVGLSMSKKICAVLHLHDIYHKPIQELEKIESVGAARAAAIKIGFNAQFYSWAVFNLTIIETKGLADRPLICFTGKSSIPRSQWIKAAEAEGYSYKNGVTKKLALLVCDDLESTSTKMKKAIRYGIEVMTYDKFEREVL